MVKRKAVQQAVREQQELASLLPKVRSHNRFVGITTCGRKQKMILNCLWLDIL